MRNTGHVFPHAFLKHTIRKLLRKQKMLFVLPLIFLSATVDAQTDTGTAPVYRLAVNNAIATYRQFRGIESTLWKGPAQEQSTRSGKGTPFFGTGDWFSGSVRCNGLQYDSVLLKYNLVRDEVIAFDPINRTAFYLFKPRVDSFTLGNKIFVHLRKKGQKQASDDGYYEQLSHGAITLLERRTKSYQENLGTASIDQRFDEKIRFYALKDGVYHELSGAKSLYALTGSYKNQIREQVKKAGLESGNDLERTLTAIAQSYNQTSH